MGIVVVDGGGGGGGGGGGLDTKDDELTAILLVCISDPVEVNVLLLLELCDLSLMSSEL